MAKSTTEKKTTTNIYPSLELPQEFQEVFENRSSPIEEIVKKLKEGTILWKVRSYNNWYRRKYFLDVQAGKITYDPTHKFWRTPCTEISFEEIVDVRLGWKTDTFNKIGHKVEKDLVKNPEVKPLVEENLCFSIIHGRSKQSLDLVAPSSEIAKDWVNTLKHFLTVVEGLRQEQRFERWLKQKFQEADSDKNGSLNFTECCKLLKRLNVKMSSSMAFSKFEESNTNKNTRDSEQVLDEVEFVDFFLKLMTRPEIQDLYNKYSESKKDMNSIQLCQFLQKEQHMETITPQECLTLIEAFEQSSMRQIGKLSLMGFTQMLLSETFELFNSDHRVVYQDMSQPLAHYYIASSHNTYLTGHQISGESSVEGYIDALKRGCRCVELDCWDGPENEPIVYHGYTLTTKINFKDIIVDAIKPYAFHASEYPVILSLENHCSPEQQEVLAKHLVEILGDLLYADPVDPELENLPSPEFLKGKIIIKAKKVSTDDDSDTTDEEGEDVTKKSQSGIELSNLVNLCQAVHFKGFQYTKNNGKCYEMSSFSEAKALKFIDETGDEFVNYNKKHLCRIYPAAKRTDSSNFKPIPYWNVGCQMVALNYQKSKKPVFLNDSKFRQNGNCGFLLKPQYLRDASTNYDPSNITDFKETILKLKIISGQYIPKPQNDDEGEVVDPYVKVRIVGHPKDNNKLKTDAVHNNGFNPCWNHVMEFVLKLPELAMVHFVVKDKKNTGKDETLGTYALPFTSIKTGYRHIYLMDYERNYVSPSTLFVHVDIINP